MQATTYCRGTLKPTDWCTLDSEVNLLFNAANVEQQGQIPVYEMVDILYLRKRFRDLLDSGEGADRPSASHS